MSTAAEATALVDFLRRRQALKSLFQAVRPRRRSRHRTERDPRRRDATLLRCDHGGYRQHRSAIRP